MVIVLAAMLIAGQAYGGWGGGRRGGGWYGSGPEPGVQGDTDEQGPWVRPGPGHGGPDAGAWQGGPGRGRGGPDAFGPQTGGSRMGRGWGRGYNGPDGPRAGQGRVGRPGRGYQEADICPYCQGSGRRPVMQGWPMRGNRGQGLRGGRVERGFRRGANLPGGGAWNGPRRGLQGRNFGPQGPGPMMQRGPWGDYRGRGPRPGEGIGRDFQGRQFGPQGPGPIDKNQDQGFGLDRGGRGFRRGDGPGPQGQGQDFNRPDRDERPFPGPRGGRGLGDRPGLRRGPGGPVEPPEVEGSDAAPEAPTDANSPNEDTLTNEGV